MSYIKKVTIYGERCSGTNYLDELLHLNFDISLTWDYGRKHFFGFNDLTNSEDVLFIGIVRNLPDWVNSLFREKHHLHIRYNKELNEKEKLDYFLNKEHTSFNHDVEYDDKEILEDRNIFTGNKYINIFELRHIKNKFLIEIMPTLAKNYCLITHDDLLTNFVGIMNKIKNHNLKIKNDIEFPLNITFYKNVKHTKYVKKENTIPNEIILKKANLFYEKILFPQYNY